MQLRYKVFIGSIALGIVLATIWSVAISLDPGFLKNFMAAVVLISMVAGPVDLVATLIAWLLKKKEWALGLLMSAAFFIVVLAIGYFVAKHSSPDVPAIM